MRNDDILFGNVLIGWGNIMFLYSAVESIFRTIA